MSPKTFKALPKSPASGGRTSSSGASLRPVLPFGLDDGSAIEEDFDELEQPELGPIPTGRTAPFAANDGANGQDAVELSPRAATQLTTAAGSILAWYMDVEGSN